MLRRIAVLSLLLASVFLTGCANVKPMALQKDSEVIAANGKPIFLMTVTLKNNYMPSYQPKAFRVNLEKTPAKESTDYINFDMDDKSKIEDDTAAAGNTYLLRMELENGDYVLRGISGTSGTFPIHGVCFAPLHIDVKSSGSGVFYLGHVAATVRARTGNEFKAGPSFPVIDQAATGFSGGTFDIAISDEQTADEAVFKEKFPALRGVTIQKSILANFDKAKAQQWWEAH